MSNGKKSLEVDVLAREIVRDLASVFGAYDLRLSCGAEKSEDGETFTGRPIEAKFPSACAVCRRAIRVGESILYAPDRPARLKTAHLDCGEVEV